ncbi:HlyD family secretion protein [Pedobacter antarcticus]|uniref:HlyD family secretion protein n=1 Tax=Pedobacter antarcticus TaxID=34086 RepID=UPI002930363C|nr:HlyD family secretion protein [Pedobacter antarcticus]
MTKQNTFTKTDKIITRITTWIAATVGCFLMVWGIITLYHLYTYEETEDAQVEAYINPVTARVSGFIREIRYQENQDVKKGDTLLMIDSQEYQLDQEQALAGLQNSRDQIGVLESNIKTAQEIALAKKADISGAKSKLIRQQQEYERYKKLFESESATKQQMEDVQSGLDVAKADYQASLNNYQASVLKIEDNKAQIKPVISEIKRRELILKRNALNVSYTVITAPYNGKMGRRTIQIGQQIQIGQTLAFIVDQESGVWVIANFKETQLHNMKVGQQVEIVTDAYPNKKIKGNILSLSPATGSRFSLLPPDNSTGNFVKIAQRIPVKIKIDYKNPELSFLNAGMNASVKVLKGL